MKTIAKVLADNSILIMLASLSSMLRALFIVHRS